jgi:hypothetical protein
VIAIEQWVATSPRILYIHGVAIDKKIAHGPAIVGSVQLANRDIIYLVPKPPVDLGGSALSETGGETSAFFPIGLRVRMIKPLF